jgi:tetratricopeptide (TPR) repeat protein
VPKPLALGAIVLCTSALLAGGAAAAAALTESARLAAVYDTILQARLSRVEEQLAATCPPAPREACLDLRAAALWWRIQIDPNCRAIDGAMQQRSAAAVDAATAWTRREPNRAEAWFYLAGAYGPLSQWRVLRGERLTAARDGVRIKEALERALALDPALKDAYFGIGLYHYVADVMPAPLKLVRFLLLMPGGDREKGLQEMLTARAQGVLLAGEADYQLHYIYLWYEHQPAKALELLRGLDARYPSNPIFLQRIAEVHRDYLHERAASRAAWQTLFDRAASGRVEFAPITLVRARIELADDLLADGEFARALAVVQPAADGNVTAPYGAAARAHLLLGRAYAAQKDPARAIAALDRAIALAPDDDPDGVVRRARDERARLRSANRAR